MRNVLASGVLFVALMIAGCSSQAPVGTLRLTDHLAFGGTVVDTRTDGAILLQTQGHAPVLVPAEQAVFQVGDRVVPPSELLPGSPVMATIGPQEARIVSLSPSVVTLQGDDGVFQVPLSALPAPVQTSTFVQVQRDGGVSVLPLQQVVTFVGPTSTLLMEPARTTAWDPYALQHGVLLGRYGEHLLVAAPSGALYTVPQGRVDLAQGVAPGSAVLFTTTDRGLFLEPWTLERRTGLFDLDPLNLNLQLVQRLDGAALVMAPDDTTFLLPGGIPLRVDGRLMPLASVPLGSWVTATFPATTAELLTLDGGIGTFLFPHYGVVQLPVSALPADTLAQTRVQVLKRNGKTVVVPLVAALNMQRAQGATLSPWLPPSVFGAPHSTQGVLTAFTGEHILLASADGGRVRLRQLPQDGLSQPVRRWVGRPVEVAGEDRDFRLHPWADRELALEVKRRDDGGGRDRAGNGGGAPRLHSGAGNGGGAPRVHSGGGNGGGSPRVHSGAGNGGGAPRVRSGGGNGGGAPRVHSGGGNGGGAPRVRSGGGNGGGAPRVHSGGGNGGGAPRVHSGAGNGGGAPRVHSGGGNGGGSPRAHSGGGGGKGR